MTPAGRAIIIVKIATNISAPILNSRVVAFVANPRINTIILWGMNRILGACTMNAILLGMCLSGQAVAQPPVPEVILPVPQLPPPAVSLVPVIPAKPPSFDQFVATFVPVPGIHDVTIIHPVTRKPVNVVFRLPNEPLRKSWNTSTRITFNYGRSEVKLIFRIIGGKVDVRYD
jgi:hypothetical protein